MTSTDDEMNIPDELLDKLQNFQQDFEKMTEILNPLYSLNINSTDYQLDPLDRARLNLVYGYALNSLFWMYLNTLGIDPKEHKIKGELERYKYFMSHIKEIADKDKAPMLNKAAAGRFIRSALWEPKESESENPASSSKEPEVQAMRMKQERVTRPHRENFERNKRRRY